MMKFVGVLFILLGVVYLFSYESFISWMEDELESKWLYISAIITRFVFGILFVIAARESKYPRVIKFFGFLFILFAIIFISIGHNGFQEFAANMVSFIKPYAPVSGLLIIALGGFLYYAYNANKDPNDY